MKKLVALLISLSLVCSFSLANGISRNSNHFSKNLGVNAFNNLGLAALPAPGTSVISNPEGWWGTGLMIGTIASQGWEHGFFWNSGELDFNAAGGLSTPDMLYPTKEYNMSVLPESSALWSTIERARKTVVVKYRYPFFNLSTNSNYIVTSIERPNKDFTETASYQQYPGGIENRSTYGNGLLSKQKSARGKIIHVARWGQNVISHRCTVYLHRGGTAKTKVQQAYQVPEWDSEKREFVEKTRHHWVDHEAVNIVHLDTFNEAICQYAEDAAQSKAEVAVGYSGYVPKPDPSITALDNPIIHKIVVEDPDEDDYY